MRIVLTPGVAYPIHYSDQCCFCDQSFVLQEPQPVVSGYGFDDDSWNLLCPDCFDAAKKGSKELAMRVLGKVASIDQQLADLLHYADWLKSEFIEIESAEERKGTTGK